MPFGSVRLIPGVNAERTPTLLEASYATSGLIRFKDGLVQKLGGYTKYFPSTVSGVPRALHAWDDLNQVARLAVGTTTQLDVITSGNLSTLTPQTKTTDFTPRFTTVIGSASIQSVDNNIADVTVYDSIYFNTPVTVGGLVLSGLYQITSIAASNAYTFNAAAAATIAETTAGAVPRFNTTTGTSSVTVDVDHHGLSVGNTFDFPISTTVGGVTIVGVYTVITVPNANSFTIAASNLASSTTIAFMNAGNVEMVYYITLGPAGPGTGYGFGTYGSGVYGGSTIASQQIGTTITATDWSFDNWGKLLLACPAGGGIYTFDPNGGFQNAGLVSTAPPFNGGIFVSMSTQILVAWGSTARASVGVYRDPMLVRWCASGDFTDWVPTSRNQAGSFRIPIGSSTVGGLQTAQQGLIWTDLDLWAMSYLGYPLVFAFNKIASGCGLAGQHAAGQLRSNVFWMGANKNFYVLGSGGVQVLPCPVWDAVFQDLDTTNIYKVRAAPNTVFNEMCWYYPSISGGTGECDKYVKINVAEPGTPWDYGSLARSAWIDQSVLGTPIGASPQSAIYQHEQTNDADGAPLVPVFTTGYFMIAEGEDFSVVDQILPDFRWGTFAGSQTAQVKMTFNLVDFPGDTPRTYGPYTVTQATQMLSVRMRGRQMSITCTSNDTGSFWRLGRVRYRYAPDGRR